MCVTGSKRGHKKCIFSYGMIILCVCFVLNRTTLQELTSALMNIYSCLHHVIYSIYTSLSISRSY